MAQAHDTVGRCDICRVSLDSDHITTSGGERFCCECFAEQESAEDDEDTEGLYT